MSIESERESLIDAYHASRVALLAAIEGLSEDEINEASLDGWSVKQHLGHVAQWDEVRFYELERIDAGLQPACLDFTLDLINAFNEMGAQARGRWSLAQIMHELETSRERVLRAVASLGERGLDDAHYVDVSPRGGIAHETEHAELIRRWRRSRR